MFTLIQKASSRDYIRHPRILIIGLFILLITYSLWHTYQYKLYLRHEAARNSLDDNGADPDGAFLVDTPGCKIPDVDPFDEAINHLIKSDKPVKCEAKAAITFVDGPVLRVNRTALIKYYDDQLDYCEYQEITRPREATDNAFNYGKTVVFHNDTVVRSEFLRVACFGINTGMLYANFHAFILPKTHLESKLENRFRAFYKNSKSLEAFDFLILGVDSVSRLNYMRQMPQTRKYLLEELKGIELHGYNKVADNTYVNLVPMFAGKYVEELPWDERQSHLPFDGFQFLWNNASSNGYRTMYAEDAPNIAIFNYEKAGFHRPPADYYLRPLSLAMEAHRSIWNSNHDCIGPKLETSFVLDWIYDFMDGFQTKARFAFAFLTRLTHDGLSRAGAADEPYLNFFKKLNENGLLKNTVILFYSDHGMRFGPIRETYIGKLEERLPFITFILPKQFHETYPHLSNSLKLNAHRITTPFDVFETLSTLMKFTGRVPKNDLSNRGLNLFSEISVDRTCAHASILPHWCTCHQQKPISPSNPTVIGATHYTIQYINTQLMAHGLSCAVLQLIKITDARTVAANDNIMKQKSTIHELLSGSFKSKTAKYTEYSITFQTSPGDALFEVTIHSNNKGGFEVMGDISRINRYGDQSTCIQYHLHKKYCFCI